MRRSDESEPSTTDLTVAVDCDPPLRRADVAAFTARALAMQVRLLLAAHGMACRGMTVTATACDGRELAQTWSTDAPLSAETLAEWLSSQLEEWLAEPGLGICALRLSPQGFPMHGWSVPLRAAARL
ncbi:MAG TPA: hypothetical protein VE172_03940 [Stackebrandtia sp.]|uniref:hypothetical protein n=1 Tax=Stackebrandtia sp. TaxID=2023065 RepID=UPI002D3C264A|nr:hypothetical protein [Stackebrandtia sp.]HZE37941.1 hypothetical protein [Stackebrandtia sp.]